MFSLDWTSDDILKRVETESEESRIEAETLLSLFSLPDLVFSHRHMFAFPCRIPFFPSLNCSRLHSPRGHMATVFRGLTSWPFPLPSSSLFPVRITPGRMRSGLWTLLSRSGNYHQQKSAHGPNWGTTLPGPIAVCVSLKGEWSGQVSQTNGNLKPTPFMFSHPRQGRKKGQHKGGQRGSHAITHGRPFIRPRPAFCISFLQNLCSCLHLSPLRQTGWSSNQSSAML